MRDTVVRKVVVLPVLKRGADVRYEIQNTKLGYEKMEF